MTDDVPDTDQFGRRYDWETTTVKVDLDKYGVAKSRGWMPIESAPTDGTYEDIEWWGYCEALLNCQDISFAGKGAGLAGERSGLWSEYARIIGELRPQFVIVENVSALLSRGLGDVLGDLAALGYDAEWHCVRASDVGAPHRRDRVFVVAHANTVRESQPEGGERDKRRRAGHSRKDLVANADHVGQSEHWGGHELSSWEGSSARSDNDHARSPEPGLGREPHGVPQRVDRWPAPPHEPQHEWEAPRTIEGRKDFTPEERSARRKEQRVRRLKALGNAVVPQVAEVIGQIVRCVAAAESEAA